MRLPLALAPALLVAAFAPALLVAACGAPATDAASPSPPPPPASPQSPLPPPPPPGPAPSPPSSPPSLPPAPKPDAAVEPARPDAADARASAARFMPLAPNTLPLRFGADQTGGKLLQGDIDRVRLYARPLTAAEVAAEASHTYGACNSATGCLGDWTFDAHAAGAFASAGPTPMPAKLVGPGEVVDAPEGKAVRLSGGYLQIEDHPALALTTGLTYSAWVRHSASCATSGQCPRARWIDKGNWFAFEGVKDHAHWTAVIAHPGPFHSQQDGPKPDVYYHVAVTYEPTALVIYVNGKVNRIHRPEGVVFNLRPNDRPLRIGADSRGGEYLAGDLDKLRFYNRALGAQEIAAEAAQQYQPCAQAGGCAAEWDFDAASSPQGSAPALTIASSGGAALAGTLGGAAEIVDGISGKALRLNKGWMDVADNPALAFQGNFSFTVWVKRAAACPPERTDMCYLERLFAKGDLLLDVREGGLRAIADGKFMLTGTGPKRDAWTHLAVTVDRNDGAKLYAGGKLIRGWIPGVADNLCYNCPGNPR